MLTFIVFAFFFLSFIAYFLYCFFRFFNSKIGIAQIPLYVLGFLWGAFRGDFFGLKNPENSSSLLGLFTHYLNFNEIYMGGYLVQGETSGSWLVDFFIDFSLVFVVCHLHGFLVTPIVILATIEFLSIVLATKTVLK